MDVAVQFLGGEAGGAAPSLAHLGIEFPAHPGRSVGDPADVPPVRHGDFLACLDAAFEKLPPSGRLVITNITEDVVGGLLGSQGERGLIDFVGSALFLAGFTQPRYRDEGNGRWSVAAVRGDAQPPLQRQQLLSVIVPVFNEQATFAQMMTMLLTKDITGMDIEVVVVESNSTDGTRTDVEEFAGHPRVTLVLETSPKGKGHAVRRGLDAAVGDFVLIQDADLEYSLDDYESLLAPLRDGSASFVLGCRTAPRGSGGMRHFETQRLLSWTMNFGHVAFLSLFNFAYGVRLKDPFTMYKVFRRDCIHGMLLECDRFDFDWELTAKLIRAGYFPREIPVKYVSRSFDEGKKIRFIRDPLSWIVACAKYRFQPMFAKGYWRE